MYELDDDDRAELAARGQKIVIWSIVLNFVLRAVAGANALPALVITGLGFAIAAWSLLGVLRICSALAYRQGTKLACMALSFVPLVNLVSLVVLNVRAIRLLRQQGWRVGLFGARR